MSHVRCASDGSEWIYAEIVELVITRCRLWHLSGSLCKMSAQSVGRRRQMRNKYHWAAVIWTRVDGRCQLRRTVSTSVHILIVTHRTAWPSDAQLQITLQPWTFPYFENALNYNRCSTYTASGARDNREKHVQSARKFSRCHTLRCSSVVVLIEYMGSTYLVVYS